ncbi:ComEA family DNA-binding protein [Winogradskyella immobilis]|uniref:Helix-hairpin-helix domain-containing protein n=1 Tax=Winogradskyella immobilis TaxID=2816852 RepID=A0ABS8ELM7_9FLAO|nr:helix-hairpin-helix domain-containing protein [Winogradskyella immobilis]MCC1484119.1 helix-hairpin-helix domain-containing protein [Winogradskyella immobilis]MCG0016211.1 helix-hairpin-helix domain-containing protein [Winogradskyella immobilis]
MKSHFQFSKKQRSGIFLLIIIILSIQSVYLFVDFSKEEDYDINEAELEHYRKEVDSLRSAAIEDNKPKLFPFNPNFITDYKGYTLGMSTEEIDRLLTFREQEQWINSAKQFQDVTKVSDSLLDEISPYFKFPDWVTNPKPKNAYVNNSYSNNNTIKTYADKIDLNTATAIQLQRINGVGEKLSERIINYRKKYKGGFISDIELIEIYGLKPEVIERITNQFTVKTPRIVEKLHLNTATRDELVTIKYIDYEIAKSIIEERILRDGFKSLNDLTKVEQFPANKIEIIKLYLQL